MKVLFKKALYYVMIMIMVVASFGSIAAIEDMMGNPIVTEVLGSDGGGGSSDDGNQNPSSETPSTPVGSDGGGGGGSSGEGDQNPSSGTPSTHVGSDGGGGGGNSGEGDQGSSSTTPAPAPSQSDGKKTRVIDITNTTSTNISVESNVVYSGEPIRPKIAVKIGDKMLVEGVDYTIDYVDATNAGTAYAYISGIGDYSGITKISFTIKKADNGIVAKAKTAAFKSSKIRKRDITFNISKLLKISNAAGKITYQKSAGNRKIIIDPKTGQVTIKKGLKKGKYTITVKVGAVGDSNYESKTITCKIRITIK